MNVFLDDIRLPNMSHNENKGLGSQYSSTSTWVILRDYFEFVDFVKIKFNEIKLVSFDHDLACYGENGREFTGKDAADFLINYCLDNNKKFPSWYVHSDNTSGKSNIIGAITNYLKVVEGKDISNFRYYNNGLLDNKPV
jgi:hypothetical protein